MAGRELSETAEAVKAVMKGADVYKTAAEWGITAQALYRAVARRSPGWFQEHPLVRSKKKIKKTTKKRTKK